MAQGDIGKRFEGYQIYDQHYEKVGKVDDLFVDENDTPEYIGVKTGLFGGPSILIPMDIVRVNDVRQLVEVASDKDTIEAGLSFGDDAEITASFEDRVYAHFGAKREPSPTDRGGYGVHQDKNTEVDVAYGERSQASARAPEYGGAPEYQHPTGEREAAYYSGSSDETRAYVEARPVAEPLTEPVAESQEGGRVYDWDIGTGRRETAVGEPGHADEGQRNPERDPVRKDAGAGTTGPTSAGTVGPGMSMGDTESGEFREHDSGDEGVHQSRGDDLTDEDELRVQRSEEELRAGTREREAGSVNVRKRVLIDRERVEVPMRREEVSVERVPVSGEASEAQIGADEVSVPVVEDEVVVQKKPVVKEEIRVRKDVVHERQIVEEDVRREEVEIEDDTRHRRG
jgi:uncharacterized protein (TIGR02271 family)